MRSTWHFWSRSSTEDWDVDRQGLAICKLLRSSMSGITRVMLAQDKSSAHTRRWLHVCYDDRKREGLSRLTAHLLSILPWPVSVARKTPCPRQLDYLNAYVYDVTDAHITGLQCGYRLQHDIEAEPDGMTDAELRALAVKYIQTRNVQGLCDAVRRNPDIVGMTGDTDTGRAAPEEEDAHSLDYQEEWQTTWEPETTDGCNERDTMVQLLKDGLHGRGNLAHVAVAENFVDGLNAVLCAQPDLIEAHDENGHTPLHKACAQVRPDCAAALLSWGADVNARGGKDSLVTPLTMVALATSQKWIQSFEIDKIFCMICNAGADQWNALCVAGINYNVPRIVGKLRGPRFVRLVLQRGHFRHMAACPAVDGKTVIDECVNSECVMKMLVDSGSTRKRDIAHVLTSTNSERVKRFIKRCNDQDSESEPDDSDV